jgi:5S rRNA maturation endonuclease (ribonuclease M5)
MRYEAFIKLLPGKQTPTRSGVMCRCPGHNDKTASLSVGRANKDGGVVLHCHAGCETPAVLAAMGLTMSDLSAPPRTTPVARAAANTPRSSFGFTTPKAKPEPEPDAKRKLVCTYSYTNALGNELYQVVRYQPKDFRQRHKDGDEWIWNMDGVERVLYHFPEVIKSSEVWLVEGCKDADNMVRLGFCATTNVGGAKKWLDGYSEALRGKDVILCGDNDESGREHVQLVFESIAEKAKSVKLVKVPGNVKDVSDFLAHAKDDKKAAKILRELADDATPHIGGINMPIYSMADIQSAYYKQVMLPEGMKVDLGVWLPGFRNKVRPLVPGETLMFVGDTGIGKTLLLGSLFAAFPNMPRLLFELELPPEVLFERNMAAKHQLTCVDIEKEWREYGQKDNASILALFPNLFICPEGRLTLKRFESLVGCAELKMGVKPTLVGLDYVQLVQGDGERYERVSNTAEGIKVVAKAMQCVVVTASQVDRASGRSKDINIHSAKESGALENSAGVVITAVRDEADEKLLWLKVVKSTKGGAGTLIKCNLDGARATITERSPMSDVPTPPSRAEEPEDS